MSSVTYDHVVKRYTADVTVVKDLNVEIKDKEFMVLVGPSGCGKSTALRMLAGLESITEGQIRIGERVVNNVAAKDRDIAMVFQSYALYPHMTIADNLAFGLRRRAVAAALRTFCSMTSAFSPAILRAKAMLPRTLMCG